MKTLLALMLLFVFGVQPVFAQRVFWEMGIASATVGYDKVNKQWVQDRYTLAVMSTQELSSRMSIVHPQCSPKGPKKSQRLIEIRSEIQNRFADFPSLDTLSTQANEVTDDVMKQSQVKRLSAFESLIFETLEKTRAAYQACGLQTQELDGLTLALVRRHCGRSGTKVCEGNTPKFGGTSSEIGFTAIVDWLDARVGAVSDAEARNSVLSYNQPLYLAFSGSSAVALANLTQSIDVEANKWAIPPSNSDAAKLATNAIQQIRKEQAVLVNSKLKAALLSEALPRLMNVSDRATVGILDVLVNPRQAFERVERRATEVKQNVLVGIADEVARTRIVECRKFLAKSDLQELSNCSGYKLDSVSVIQCMSQNECMPPIDAASIRRDVALYAEVLSADQLSASSMIGRVSTTYSELVTASEQCRALGGTAQVLAKCLNGKMLPPKAAEFESCVRQSQTNAARLACVSRASGAQLPVALSKCTIENNSQASCLLNAVLPQIWQDVENLQACLKPGLGKSQIKNCISKLPLGGDAAKLVSCMPGDEKVDTAKLALCLGGNSLPKDIRQAVACFAEGEGALAATAACMAKQALPGVPAEVSKLLVCAAESQGDPLGTAICSASDSMNAELRIALQCAVSSGGEPSATAACTFGRLTLKELQQCSGKKFGDEGCFGKGNEIQKLAKVLLGQEIDPNSVVGQVITFNLTAMKDAVAFSEATFKEGGKLVSNIGKEASAAGQAVSTVVANIAREQEKLIQNAGKAAEKAVQDFGKAAGGIVQQILPKVSCCRFRL